MKHKITLFSIALSSLFIIPSMADETPLAEQMSAMNDAYKAMRSEKDLTKGAALAREAQDAMIKSITETPEMLAAMADGPEKAKQAATYRKMMSNLILSLVNLELAFLEGDTAKVESLIASMREMKKEGHDAFIEE
jgi:Cytochrome b562